ncbi:hypothetical protein MKX01_010115 [Papaver californicum]|nr:hypothetical protein MKX01_010115 [Papaver californicum]
MFNSKSSVCLILQPTTPSAPQMQSIGASKTVVARNVTFSMKYDLMEFFKQAGEGVDVRYEDEHYKGAYYIEFATEATARKLTLLWKPPPLEHQKPLQNLSFSTTKSDVIEFFKQAGEIVDVRFSLLENGDFRNLAILSLQLKKVQRRQLRFDQVQSSLKELFSTCGEILYMRIPTFPCSAVPRGIAYIEFYDFPRFPQSSCIEWT